MEKPAIFSHGTPRGTALRATGHAPGCRGRISFSRTLAFLSISILSAALLFGAPQGEGDGPYRDVISANSDAEVAGAFFKLVDFSKPMVADLKPLVDGGQGAKALAIWRDRMVARLRSVDYGKFNWHGTQVAPPGLAIGCQNLSAAGDLALPGPDFEFELQGGKLTRTQVIRKPETFQWESKGPAVAPTYW